MVFSSEVFLFFFLPGALFAYLVAGRFRNAVLVAVSYLFYGWANPLFVLLMLFSTLVDYLLGRMLVAGHPADPDGRLPKLPKGIPRTRRQLALVWTSVVVNLGLLGFFKYADFGLENLAAVADATGLPGLDPGFVLHITLPLGISFYSFQSMSYAIDVYRGDARPVRNIVDFAAYVSLFPQLVAGPIIRYQEVADQLLDRTHTVRKVARGIAFFSLGLAKKVVLANPAGAAADLVFDATSVSTLDAWLGTYAYALQIYFDFSAYSDMAIGLGLMLGFVFPKNFDAPYRSASITEFWRRWHISLSSFLRDYLYISLGGNRHGVRRTYLNLALVMLLGGLWHGASWNFVVWGAIHGGLLAAERAWSRTSPLGKLPRPAKVALTFLAVCFAWVFFRAPTLPAALSHLQTLAGLQTGSEPVARLVSELAWTPLSIGAMALGTLVVWGSPWQVWDFTRHLTPVGAGFSFAALLLAIALLSTQSYNPFIYFIF